MRKTGMLRRGTAPKTISSQTDKKISDEKDTYQFTDRHTAL